VVVVTRGTVVVVVGATVVVVVGAVVVVVVVGATVVVVVVGATVVVVVVGATVVEVDVDVLVEVEVDVLVLVLVEVEVEVEVDVLVDVEVDVLLVDVVVVEPSRIGERFPVWVSVEAPGTEGNESCVLMRPSSPAQPTCPVGMAGTMNVLSTTVKTPVPLLYGTPPVFAVLKFTASGPSGHAVRFSAAIARFTEIDPESVIAPLSGSILPVKSEFAIGEMFTSSGSGLVTCTRNGVNDAFACGNVSPPAPVAVPFESVPVMDRRHPVQL
jgi:hypothetical protein